MSKKFHDCHYERKSNQNSKKPFFGWINPPTISYKGDSIAFYNGLSITMQSIETKGFRNINESNDLLNIEELEFSTDDKTPLIKCERNQNYISILLDLTTSEFKKLPSATQTF